MEYLQIYKRKHMYTADVFTIQQWEKSAKMSKAAFSSIAEKMSCALRFACCTAILLILNKQNCQSVSLFGKTDVTFEL